MKLEIFEPSLCCDSGVCGPEPDNALIDLQNTIQILRKSDIETNRFAINQAPIVFVKNDVIKEFIKTYGPGKLPVSLLDGKIIAIGKYPTLDDLRLHIPGLKSE